MATGADWFDQRRAMLALAIGPLCGTVLEAADNSKKKPTTNHDPLPDETKLHQTVKLILDERKQQIEGLIALVDSKNSEKHGPKKKAAAAYLLGELRAVEAVPALVTALAEEKDYIAEAIDPYERPVSSALYKIGRPAVPELLKQLQASDNHFLRNNALFILNRTLGGKRRLFLEVLAKVEQRANKESIHRVREGIKHVETRYKEQSEPLF